MSSLKISEIKPGYIAGIDILRFVAALVVVFYHTLYLNARDGKSAAMFTSPDFGALSSYFHFGWVGVQIFFVISGFVIYDSAAHSDAKRFIIGRFIRLAPAVWICAPLSILVGFALGNLNVSNFVHPLLDGLFFFPIYPWPESTYWTLGIECVFYALIAGCLALNRLKYVRRIVFALASVSALFWMMFYFLHDEFAVFDRLRASRFFELALLQHAPYFAIGIFLSEFRRTFKINYGDGIAMGCFFLGSCLEIWAVNDEINSIAHDAMSAFMPILVWSLALVAIVGFSMRQMNLSHSTLRFIRFLGLTTYPLYLIHGQLGLLISLNMIDLIGSPINAAFFGVIGSVTVAIIVARWPEPWLREKVKMLISATSWVGKSVAAGP